MEISPFIFGSFKVTQHLVDSLEKSNEFQDVFEEEKNKMKSCHCFDVESPITGRFVPSYFTQVVSLFRRFYPNLVRSLVVSSQFPFVPGSFAPNSEVSGFAPKLK